jgi:hypothetical protein
MLCWLNENLLMVDGNEVESTELAVDARDDLGYLTLQLGRVRGDGGRAGNLNEHDIANPLWVIMQEFLECTKLCIGLVSGLCKLLKKPTFCTTPLTTSSLSRPTMIFLPS